MSTNSQPLPLSLHEVSYRRQGTTLIDQINLEIKSTESTIILGHNGSGKSLLLKLFHGVIKPCSGTILWNNLMPNTKQYWRTFLLQKPTFFNRSVKYNLEFVLKLAGVPSKEHKRRRDQALEVCGLKDISNRDTYLLSGGEIQKLSLARAWVLQPSVILLDEPTVALDPPSVLGFEKIIQNFKQSNTKVIMTTHDLSQAKRLAEEIVFIDRGKILEQSAADCFFAGPTSHQAQKFISGKL